MSFSYQTNLFCIMKSAKMKISIKFGNSKVIFINRGKEYKLPKAITTLKTYLKGEHIYELIIDAVQFEEALNIIDLIRCSYAIITSEKFIKQESLRDSLAESCGISFNTSKYYSVSQACVHCSYSDNLFYAIQMASKAFMEPQLENAILKYDMARELIEINPLDLSPFNYVPNRIFSHSEQLKFAYAIITSYSIIEELNLEIRASVANPSLINGGTEWNPSVLEDLKKRLISSNIKPEKTIPWLVRDDKDRPFKTVVNSNNLCEWSDGGDIRDFEITIYDAILELSFIRDKLASHGVRSRVYELTIYDTENAYALLRSILLFYFLNDDERFMNWYEGF